MSERERVVFDCNVYFQALISPAGPAGRLFALAAVRSVDLFVSEYVLAELHELTQPPHAANRDNGSCGSSGVNRGFILTAQLSAQIIAGLPK